MNRLFAIIMVLVLVLSACGAKSEDSMYLSTALSAADAQKEMCGVKGKNLLSENDVFPSGTPVCDWTAIAFSLIGEKDDYDAYLESLEKYVSEKYCSNGKLDRAKATEWHRISLAVLALGGDPTAFGKDAEGNAIDLIADGTYNYINDDLGEQGVNGFIYALITLDAGNYEVPEGSKYTRESIIENILSMQNEDGGFGLMEGYSGADITAMAIQALGNYADDEKIKNTLEEAVAYLSENQDGDGAYSSGNEKSSESCCQVIIALCELGIDPRTDARFIKHKKSVYDALMNFALEDGSFVHNHGDKNGNAMATEQAMLAIAAIMNFDENKNELFDFYN